VGIVLSQEQEAAEAIKAQIEAMKQAAATKTALIRDPTEGEPVVP
jgi:hypothetical protein